MAKSPGASDDLAIDVINFNLVAGMFRKRFQSYRKTWSN